MINICISIQIGVGSYVLGICGDEDYISSLVFLYVGIMNEGSRS